MKKKVNYRPNFLLILYCINIFILFLAPFLLSEFDGDNISSIRTIINFKVGFLGNWLEYLFFPNVHDEYNTIGSANEIGIYSQAIIPFIIMGLIFSLIGAILVGVKKDYFEADIKRIKQIAQLKLIGIIFSLLGGLFGIVSLIFFSKFKSSIVIPYVESGFIPSNSIPSINFVYGYIISLIIFIVFIITGLAMLAFSIRTFYQTKKSHGSNDQKTPLLNNNDDILGVELSSEEKKEVSVE
ncbi:MAG: hypothetical protein ACTSSK_01105 [Candidatus Heimdallarchaeota archaeon]